MTGIVAGGERRWEERVQRAAHPVVYPLLARLRAPVRRIPGVGVVVTDPAILRTVLLDTATFTKTGPGSPADLWTPVLGPRVLLNMEGADHVALRRRLGPLFAPAAVEALVADSLGAELSAVTSTLAAGGEVDLVEVARRSATRVIRRLVGIEGELGGDLFARISAITGYVRLTRHGLTPPQVAAAREVLDELTVHARAAYAAGDESTVPGRMRGLGLSEDEAMGAVGAFVLTGTETIVSHVPRMIAILLDTGWLRELARDDAPLENAIAESLRVTTPTPVMLRSVVAEARVGSVPVRPGDRLVLATFLADRASGRFDPVAAPAVSLKQLWFGAGVHFCLGAPLAMAQIRATLEAVLAAERASPLRIVRRRAVRRSLIPGYASLVVTGAAPDGRATGRASARG
ncbi:cytochrome P450 [Cnuibacter sp. UC19_7]|uniref:cytochrome P450 n=1 Tax=Cnuibacter sp. UC19_7 TaxID=3350166 RepID=UPI00366EAA80